MGRVRKPRPRRADASGLVLPDVIATDVPGLTLRKGPTGHRVPLEIVVGPQHQWQIEAIAEVVDTEPFDIYLVPEDDSHFGAQAVVVMAANLPIGYVAPAASAVVRGWHAEALERGELLWGAAWLPPGDDEVLRISGYVWMAARPDPTLDIRPLPLDVRTIERAAQAIARIAASPRPATVTAARQMATQMLTPSLTVLAHVRWLASQGPVPPEWMAVEAALQQVFIDARTATYLTDLQAIDLNATAHLLADTLDALRAAPADEAAAD